MKSMDERYEHYRKRFRAAMDARKIPGEVLAERVEAHPVTISKLRTGALKINEEWRLRLAASLNLPEEVLFGEDDLPEPRPYEIHASPKRRRQAARPRATMLPVYGLAAGSMRGAHSLTSEPVDEVACPPALVDALGAYALQTSGESMIPRYFPGERLYVNPNQKVVAGDHVIVQVMLHDSSGTETWVKRFDGEDAENIFVWQYNPPAKVAFKKRYVIHVHRVLPVNELFG